MNYTYNDKDGVFWFATTKQIAEDMEIVKQKSAKAGALEAWGTIYMADGTDWLKSDGTALTYYALTLTVGANTSLTVTSTDGKVYQNGDRVYAGTSLTITAAADDGYTLSTYTVNTVDKTADNPTTHVAAADITIVTAATEA